jgi:hypothetical protein
MAVNRAGSKTPIEAAFKPCLLADPPQIGTASRLGFMAGEFSVPDYFDRMGGNEVANLFAGRKP